MRYDAYFDGGARGKGVILGPAACAAILLNGDVVHEHVEDLGNQTNNVAEYRGLEYTLRLALEHLQPGDELYIYSDSKLVVNQVLGTWSIKALHLRTLRDHVHYLGRKLKEAGVSLKISHVPREENARADELVTDFLDRITGRPR